jgi:hypothetical protein
VNVIALIMDYAIMELVYATKDILEIFVNIHNALIYATITEYVKKMVDAVASQVTKEIVVTN